MRRRTPIIAAALTVLTISALPGQDAGTVEVGGFARYTRFDRSLGLDDAFGGGGWVGVFIAQGLALEGTGGYLPTAGPLVVNSSLIPLHARLVFARPVAGPLAVLLGAGYVHNVYGRTANVSDDGVSGLLGLRFSLGPALAARIEASEDFIPSPANQSASIANNWNLALQAGLSVRLGSSRPRDHDHDGVQDQVDACPWTPAGETVDARGCASPKDSDGDGVVDTADRCPNTPGGDAVDRVGCPVPKDTDGDHVIDGLDRCPNTPPGEPVNAAGCPLDSDGDGVIDTADKCPATPGGTDVDATGCPVAKDSDGDGVVDSADRCAASPAGERVDATGCPVLFAESERTLVLEGVTFETGSAILSPLARAVLGRVAAALTAHASLRVEVAGYSDNRGAAVANQRLSQTRAEAVRGYRIERGVSPEQVTALGYGENDPIDTNATAAGRARNRRVELHRLN
jgi:outer membrane protein OmpA-like peptidoglycan-associated protein